MAKSAEESMRCKGCDQNRRLVKSHIIPESFYRGLREDRNGLKMFSKGEHPKKSPIGVYDKFILCEECEDKFDKIDSYGYEILINREDTHEKLELNGKLYGYRVSNIDTDRLKLFFMSILWRASISTHSFFERVELGPLESKLKTLIWNNDAGSIHEFSYAMSKFESNSAGRTILSPHAERFFGIRYYRFYLFGFTLYIKTDSQATPAEWVKFIPINGTLIIANRGRIEEKQEYPVMLDAYSHLPMEPNVKRV